MKTVILSGEDTTAIERAADALRRGGVVAFPTDTVYGIGAMVFDPRAVAQLYVVKERPPEKSIPILIGQRADAQIVTSALPAAFHQLAEAFWPGALTIVVPKLAAVPEIVSAGLTVGVRLPDHPLARALLRRTGPLAVTSANRSGGANTMTAAEVLAQLEGRIELIVDGGACPGGLPSTVVDCTTTPPILLRPGPITMDQIKAALG